MSKRGVSKKPQFGLSPIPFCMGIGGLGLALLVYRVAVAFGRHGFVLVYILAIAGVGLLALAAGQSLIWRNGRE